MLAFAVACGDLTDPSAPAWTHLGSSGVAPHWGQTATYDARRDRMLVFGGENGGGQLNELLVLHLDSLQWEHVTTSPTLGGRTDLASAIDTVRDRLVIIGGRVGLTDSIDEVWALDLTSNQWTRLPSGPAARHDVPATSDGAHAWVFGGAGGFLQSLQDLWQLDFATDTWSMLPVGADVPPARGSSALAYHDNAIYLVGGHDVSMAQHDAWRYDLTQKQWSRLSPSGAPAAWAHYGYAVDGACGALVLVGGDDLDNEDTALGVTLTLGPTPAFALLPASELPPPVDHASLIVDGMRRRLVLFGGGTLGDGLSTLSGAWIYNLGACP
jgi:hypothetical protein